MIIVLSPSKTLDTKPIKNNYGHTLPVMLKQSEQLVAVLRKMSAIKLAGLMDIGKPLAELNVQRYAQWSLPFTTENAKQAIYAFAGDVYDGLAAPTLDQNAIDFAQQHVRILSGLYGVLRPLDLMMPYRLEMGTNVAVKKHKNLYQFWADTITKEINKAITDTKSKLLLNLSSQEYFKAIDTSLLKAPVLVASFKRERNGQYQFIMTEAKKARGSMARYIVENKITETEHIKGFDTDGYTFAPNLSDDKEWVFVR